MKRNGKEKEFDAVQMMRKIRDQIDRDIAGMTFAEQKAYIKKLSAKAGRSVAEKTERSPT